MRLSDFLRSHSEEILKKWDEFASTVAHGGELMDQKALRDHAAQILTAIADDLDTSQTAAEQIAKSRGAQPRDANAADTAAETHADTRMLSGFSIKAMLTEYRALRASVLQMWADASVVSTVDNEMRQLTRFNEAIDQAIAESVARYSEQVDRATNLFIGMLGHDIRNPLGTIQLVAEIVERGGGTAKSAELIKNAAKRIQSIVELVVDFSRAQSNGAMPIKPVRGQLGAVFAEIVAETRIRHPSTTLMFEGGDLDTEGEWDLGRMGQLLSNLLENAVLYGARNTPVVVRLASDDNQVTFTVHNQGQPIPLQDRERIFEPRHRGAGGDQRSSGGLGLGLYICREIVRAHGGTLSVRSAGRVGTTFTGCLPRHHSFVTPALRY